MKKLTFFALLTALFILTMITGEKIPATEVEKESNLFFIKFNRHMLLDEFLATFAETPVMLTEILVQCGVVNTAVLFDSKDFSIVEIQDYVIAEVDFGINAMQSSLESQIFALDDDDTINGILTSIDEIEQSREMLQQKEIYVRHLIFSVLNNQGIPSNILASGVVPFNPRESQPERESLDNIESCYGYWHAPTHGGITVSPSDRSISGNLLWENASKEFSQLHGFEFEIAFVGKTNWGNGYSSFTSTLPCYYYSYGGNDGGAAQYEAGCGTPQMIKDNKWYSYAFKIKSTSNTPDCQLSLKSQRQTTDIPYIQCCLKSSLCDPAYNADKTCRTALLSTWKQCYTW